MEKKREIQLSNEIGSAIREVYEQVRLSKRDAERLQKKILKRVAAEYWASWLTRVSDLGGTQRKYREGMSLEKGDTSFTVKLAGDLANKVEDGSGSFDMKPGLLRSGKVKYGKDGLRYVDVPFLWNTKRNTATAQKMPSSVYRAVQNMSGNKLLQSEVPPKYRFIKRKFVRMPDGDARYYRYKSSIYAGISGRTSEENEETRSYRSFRRVSTNSDYRSWIHPGFTAKKLMDAAFDDMQVDDLITNMISSYVEKKVARVRTVKRDITL